MIKYSVVIPVYNVSKFIIKTLESLEKQIYKKFEVVIINDGSTDDTVKKIEEYIVNSSMKLSLFSQANKGVSSARNFGILKSKGEYIYFLDGDDTVEQTLFLDIDNALLKDKEIDLVFFKYRRLTIDGKTIFRYSDEFEGIKYNEAKGMKCLELFMERKIFIGICTSILRKRSLTEHSIIFNEEHIIGEDQEFIMKFLSVSKKVKYVDKELFNYLIREDSATNSYGIKLFNLIYTFEELSNYFNAKELYGLGSKLINTYLPMEVLINVNNTIYLENINNKKLTLKNINDKFDNKIYKYYIKGIVLTLLKKKYFTTLISLAMLMSVRLYLLIKNTQLIFRKMK